MFKIIIFFDINYYIKIIFRRLEEQEKILQARRLHYMRSTYQINGVFASPWFPQNDFENLLARVFKL